MAKWLLGEAAEQSVADYLTANLQANITAVTADYADTLSPGTVAQIATAGQIEVDKLALLSPVIEVHCAQSDDYQFDGSSLGAEHRIAVIGTCMDDTDAGTLRTNLSKRVKRLARACIITLGRAPLTQGFAMVGWGAPMVDYSHIEKARNQSQVVAGFVVNLRVVQTEIG